MSELTTMTIDNLFSSGAMHYALTESAKQQAVINAAKSGMYFLEAKARCNHGEFIPKIEQMGLSRSTISKYMKLAKEMPELLNAPAHAHLPNLTMALELMSAPDEVKTEVLERVENGESVSQREIQRLKKEAAQLEREKQAVQKDLTTTKNLLECESVKYQAASKQRDELRDNQQQIIDAKASEIKARLVLENQQAIAENKRLADNAKAELERLKREQQKAIQDGVKSELDKLDTQINQKRYQFERIEREYLELQKAKEELDEDVGTIAIHKSSIKQIQSDLSSLTLSFSNAFETSGIPVEVSGEWDAIFYAISKLKKQMAEWRDQCSPIESEALIGELVD